MSPTKKVLLIGGKEHEVKYLFSSYNAMHEKHGLNVFDLPMPTPKTIAVLIWGAVMHADPLITPEIITVKLTMEEAIVGHKLCTEVIFESLKAIAVSAPDAKPA